MKVANLKYIASRTVGYAMTVLLLVAVVTAGYSAIDSSNIALRQMVEANGIEMQLSDSMRRSLDKSTRIMRDLALLKVEAESAEQRKSITNARQEYDAAFQQLLQMPVSDKGKAMLAAVRVQTVDGRRIDDVYLSMLKSDRESALRYLTSASIPAVVNLQQSIGKFADLQNAHNKHDEEIAFNQNQRINSLIMFFSALSVLLSMAAGWMIARLFRQRSADVNVGRLTLRLIHNNLEMVK